MANTNITYSPYASTSAPLTSSFLSTYNTLKPQVLNMLWWKRNYFTPILALKSLGMTEQVGGPQSQHLEAGHFVPNWHVGAIVSAPSGPGGSIVLGVQPQDVSLVNSVFPAMTETVRFVDGTSGYISAAPALVGGQWQITITPFYTTWTLSPSVGDSIWMIDQQSIEGSADPANYKEVPTQMNYYPLQIIRNGKSMTGSSVLTELWANKDQLGNKIDAYYLQTLELEMEHNTMVSNAAFWGDINQNPTIPGNRMYSLWYTSSTAGQTIPYNNGLFTLTNIQQAYRISKQLSAGSEYFIMGGPDFNASWQNGLSSVFGQNPIVYSQGADIQSVQNLFQANETNLAGGQGIGINLRRVNWGGTHFYACDVQQWGQIESGGAPGRTESGYAFGIPMSKSANVSGDFVSRFRLTTRALNGVTRENIMWEYGGAAASNKNGNDNRVINCLSEVGTTFMSPDQLLQFKPF